MLNWNEAVQQMALLVSAMSTTMQGSEVDFESAYQRVKLARKTVQEARTELDRHRAEHGC